MFEDVKSKKKSTCKQSEVLKKDEKLYWAVEQLKQKYESLGRIPKKDDFDDVTRARIKAYLGPWPRALEKAGLKEPTKKEKNKK